MSTAIIESKPAKEAILFSVTPATVKPMVEKYLALTISGVDDKDGIAAVRAARQDIRKARTTVESERVIAKAEYLEAGRRVDAMAKALTSELVPAEEHLVSLLDYVDTENERIANERLDKRLADRKGQLDEVGGVPSVASVAYPDDSIRSMTDERFKGFLVEMKELNDRLMAEAKERQEAAERNRIEQEKIAEERAELDKLRLEQAERQKAEQARLDEERRVENERLAAERAAEQKAHDAKLAEDRRLATLEQMRLDDQRAEQKRESDRIEAEAAKLLAEIEAARQKLESDTKAKEAAEEAVRQEQQRAAAAEAKRADDEKTRRAMLPHRDKILAYKDALLLVAVPTFPAKMKTVTNRLESLREAIEGGLTALAENLGAK